jgi:Cation transporter/ATPase, N-terminus
MVITVSSPPADEANEPPLRSSSRDPNDPVPVAVPRAPGAPGTSWPSVGAQPDPPPHCGPDSSPQLQPARACRPSPRSDDHNAGGKQQEPVRCVAAAVAPRPEDRQGSVENTQDIVQGGQSKSSAGSGNEDAVSHGLVWEGNPDCAHAIESGTIARGLEVSLQHGLSTTEAASRLARDGPNKLEEDEGVSIWKVLLRQVSNSLTMVSPPALC